MTTATLKELSALTGVHRLMVTRILKEAGLIGTPVATGARPSMQFDREPALAAIARSPASRRIVTAIPDGLIGRRELADRLDVAEHTVYVAIKRAGLKPKAFLPSGHRYYPLFDQTEATAAVNWKREPAWRPALSAAVRDFAARSSSAKPCRIAGQPCRLAPSCSLCDINERAIQTAHAAAELCSGYIECIGSGSSDSCANCRRFGSSECAFDCFRVGHEKYIRANFADSKRRPADKKEVPT